MTPCDISGTPVVATVPILSEVGQRFEVFLEVPAAAPIPARVILRIIDYRTGAKASANSIRKAAIYNGNYYSVDIAVFDAKSKPFSVVGGGLAVGTLNYPFKYRPQAEKGDFASGFNFGATLGYTIRHNSLRRFVWSAMAGFSASNISIDQVAATKNQTDLATANNFGGFSFSLGLLAQQDKVQVGMFMGWDRLGLATNNKYGWIYQGKPWLSIGWGISLFTPQKEKPVTDLKQE